ncbi:5-dehydro-4-deoxy-D-glucuronate isomerase [Mariniflexile sp. HNIBRBA6329]|uniref:5-dehydro-4-deoxy-D-glucuronate isomerase n=1 Tax=Mariniflexile sp. HNIBRBA6329 TaxID=3373088 RepID=UPI0037462D4C
MIKYQERYPSHPDDVKNYDTEKLRNEFLIEDIFEAEKINLTYTGLDRFIIGGAMPINKELSLEAIDPLKAKHFCDRREVGIINIGGEGTVVVDGKEHTLKHRDAIYIGQTVKTIVLKSKEKQFPAMFFINSATAHCAFPTKKISKSKAITMDLGKEEEANKREISQYIVKATTETCQLQMGITSLKSGNVWNTMPPHTHNRRMEVYFYTDLDTNQRICHFMGTSQETRHIWMSNNQAVISPNWSIHSGVGTSNYSFVWGMAGENLDFMDMDGVKVTELK